MTERPTAAWPRASAPPASRPASSRPATSTSACSSRDEPDTVSAARFTALRRARGAGRARARSAAASTRCARSSSTPATPTRRPGSRGLEDAARMQGAAAMAAGVHEDQVAVASTGVIGVPLPMDGMTRRDPRRRAASSRADGDARLLARDRHHRRVREAADASTSRCRRAAVRLSAQAKGAGMIQPGFATMLCFVQTDAALAARDRRPAARRLRQALLRPHLASTASSPRTTPRS